MQGEIRRNDFLEILKEGVSNARQFMDELTNYHGGPLCTEYILTSDIARSFLLKRYNVGVEVHNKKMLSILNINDKSKWPKGAKRTDVAVLDDGVFPRAIIEVKLGVNKSLNPIKSDIRKIISTISLMKDASAVRCACVFQLHFPGKDRDVETKRLEKKVAEREAAFRGELKALEALYSGFRFSLEGLQSQNTGIVATALELEEDGSKSIADRAHVTRYYAVLIETI